jgi:hypothetical protein
MTKYSFEFSQIVHNWLGFQFQYDPTSSLYLGATLPIDLAGMGSFRLGGSLTVPTGWPAQELHDSPAAAAGYNLARIWDGDTIWGTAEGMFVYPTGLGFSALAGFRWDHWQTSLKNPGDPTLTEPSWLAEVAPTDTGAITVNGFIPLIGVMTQTNGLNFGVVGFPVIAGNVEFSESIGGLAAAFSYTGDYGEGWFVEAFAEYELANTPLARNLSVGSLSLFAKVNAMQAKGRLITGMWLIGSPTPTGENETSFSFYRNMFVLGAKGTLSFNLPRLLNFL